MTMDAKALVYLIIDNIEGGYYHPDMKSKLKGGEIMGISGETMFGIDRKNGAPLFATGTPQAVQFWQIVDANFGTHHGDVSYYNDKADGKKKIAASVGAQLKPLAAQMIIDATQKNAKYLSEGARRMVYANPKLLLQFLYATYNGSGNFQNFANLVNAAYANGERSVNKFWDIVQDARRKKGGLFITQATKLQKIADGLSGSNGWVWLIGGLAMVGLVTLVKGRKK